MPGDQPASLPAQEDDALPTDLSVNLETRRKRKDGQPKITVRRSSIFATEADESAQQPVRTSAKRKLSAREAEDTGNAGVKDDFRFSRKTTGLNEPDVVEAKKRDENTAIDNAGKEENAPTESARTERRVLGDSEYSSIHAIRCISLTSLSSHREHKFVPAKASPEYLSNFERRP